MRHVILGNGAAGITAATKLRELKIDDDITIISGEDTPVYSKPMLPDYIGGKLEKQKLFLRDLDFYKKNRIGLITENKAKCLDTGSKKVMLADGSIIEYDKLLICVGGIPFVPPIEGMEGSDYLMLNSVEDADNIREKAFPGGKAVIVGAGLTGIEVGFALKRLGMDISIVEREERILPMQLDLYSSNVMVEEIRHEGIKLVLGKTVSGVIKGNRKQVKLSDGSEIDYDMLVIAIGTRSNIDCIKESGIKLGRGILVNEYMETSEKDVYAAGDVAELVDKVSNEFVSTYVWPNAMAQGKCAACCMAGVAQEFSTAAAMQNAVQLRDIPFISMGMVNPRGEGFETLIKHDTDTKAYKRLILKGNVIKGMVFIGDTSTARTISDFIRKGTDVSEFRHRLLDSDLSGIK